MTKNEMLDWLYRLKSEIVVYMPRLWLIPMGDALDMAIKTIEQEPCEDAGWIPVKWHEITDEERIQNEYPKEWAEYLDCVMPDDGQEILITTKGGCIEFDTCFHDGCVYSLDSARDWIADITAWMPLPKPYKAESEDEE